MRTFKCWNDEDTGCKFASVRTIAAYDAEHAAEEWARIEDHQGAEYSIVSGEEEPIVCVEGPKGVVTKWKVRGESCPVYSADHLPGEERSDD